MKIYKFKLEYGKNVLKCKKIMCAKIQNNSVVLYTLSVKDGGGDTYCVLLSHTGDSIEEGYKYLDTFMLLDDTYVNHVFYKKL